MTNQPAIISILVVLLACPSPLLADARDHLDESERWFGSLAGRRVMENLLSWQTANGDWPKNTDTTEKKRRGRRSELKGTFDNRATTDELRLLARAIEATGEEDYLEAFHEGFDHVLEAQYENGGWPQSSPPGRGYARHITFNDGSMVRLMEFLREARGYDFLDRDRKRLAAQAFDRGIGCILECQIVVDGKPTVWCAQHDEKTLEPAKARAYELVSFSGGESAGILHLLMSLEHPPAPVVRAIEAGVAWYEDNKVTGLRYERNRRDTRLVEDRSAKPIWARFYDIETGRPIFCDRDGVKKFSLDEIGSERRNGYAWFGNWGDKVARDYERWKRR